MEENPAKSAKGRQRCRLPGNTWQLLSFTAFACSPLDWWDTSKHLQIFSYVPSVQQIGIPNGNLLLSCASLVESKNTETLLTERANYALLVPSTPAIFCLPESCQCPKLLYERLKHDLLDLTVVLIAKLFSGKESRKKMKLTYSKNAEKKKIIKPTKLIL